VVITVIGFTTGKKEFRSMRYEKGLVMVNSCPAQGHVALIQFAAAQCDELIVPCPTE